MKSRILLLTIACIMLCIVGSNFAQDIPLEKVYVADYTGKLSAADIQNLNMKCLNIYRSDHIVIAVRIIKSLNGKAPEDYARDLFKQLGVGEKGKDNGVLLLIAMAERTTKIEIGYGLEELFTDQESGRITDRNNGEMGKHFRNNNFPGGISVAIDQMIAAIRSDSKSSSTNTATPVEDQSTSNHADSPRRNAQGSGQFIVVAFFIIMLIIIIMFLWGPISRGLEKARQINAAREQYAKKRDEVTDALKYLQEFVEDLQGHFTKLIAKVHADELKALALRIDDVNDDSKIIDAKFKIIKGSEEDLRNQHDAMAYIKATSDVQTWLRTVDAVRKEISAVEKELEILDKILDENQELSDNAKENLEFAQLAIANAKTQGFSTVGFEKAISSVTEIWNQGNTFLKEKRVTKANEFFKNAETEFARITQNVQQLPQTRDKLIKELEMNLGGLTHRHESIAAAKLVFADIQRMFAPTSWTEISGNGSTAEAHIARATELFKEAQTMCSMEVQNFDGAAKNLKDGAQLVEDSIILIDAIETLKLHLIEAQSSCDADVQHATEDIKTAWAKNAEVDDDVDDNVKTKLTNADEFIKQALAERAKDLPDFLIVVRLARQAHAIADECLAQVRTEHEAMERLRQLDVTSRRDAERKYATASDYADKYKGIVSHDTVNLIATAGLMYYSAIKITDLAKRVKAQQDAHAKAEQGLKDAMAAVAVENARLAEEQKKRDAAALAALALLNSNNSHHSNSINHNSSPTHMSTPSSSSFSGGSSGGGGSTGGW